VLAGDVEVLAKDVPAGEDPVADVAAPVETVLPAVLPSPVALGPTPPPVPTAATPTGAAGAVVGRLGAAAPLTTVGPMGAVTAADRATPVLIETTLEVMPTPPLTGTAGTAA